MRSHQTQSGSLFSSILGVLLSGYSGLFEICLDLLGQFSLHLLTSLCVTALLLSTDAAVTASSTEEL
jgi:ABC-type microcin C transport system permease subunit YejE